jgi:hypothetical protein
MPTGFNKNPASLARVAKAPVRRGSTGLKATGTGGYVLDLASGEDELDAEFLRG